MERYICDKLGITEAEIMDFATLTSSHIFLNDKKRMIEVLDKYGGKEEEIVKNLFRHFKRCNDCMGFYRDYSFIEECFYIYGKGQTSIN